MLKLLLLRVFNFPSSTFDGLTYDDGSRCVDFGSLVRFPFFVGVEWSNVDVGHLRGLDSDVLDELAEL